jgi:hypothetical protein
MNHSPRKTEGPENRGRRECRVLNAPAASRAKKTKHTSVVTTVTPDSPGIPYAMVLTAYFVLSPAIGFIVTVISGYGFVRARSGRLRLRWT